MTYTIQDMLNVAASLFGQGVPEINESEYSRGVFELIGRLTLDIHGIGEGTRENAILYRKIVDRMASK